MAAPEGYEGTFVAITFVPQYISAGLVGVMSGHLLDAYVPDDEHVAAGEVRQPAMMWTIITITSFATPLLLLLAQRFLFTEEPVRFAATASARRAIGRRYDVLEVDASEGT